MHLYSEAALLQSVGLAHAQPTPLVGAAPGNRTLTACLEGRYARRYATAAWDGPASRPRTYNRLIKSQLLRQLSYSGIISAAEGTRTPISSLKRRVLWPLSYSGAGLDKMTG